MADILSCIPVRSSTTSSLSTKCTHSNHTSSTSWNWNQLTDRNRFHSYEWLIWVRLLLQVGVWVNGPLSQPELESIHGPGHLHQAQRPSWAFVGELLERVGKREQGKGERRRRGLGAFLTSATKKQSNTNGQATAGEKSDRQPGGWSERKAERW